VIIISIFQIDWSHFHKKAREEAEIMNKELAEGFPTQDISLSPELIDFYKVGADMDDLAEHGSKIVNLWLKLRRRRFDKIVNPLLDDMFFFIEKCIPEVKDVSENNLQLLLDLSKSEIEVLGVDISKQQELLEEFYNAIYWLPKEKETFALEDSAMEIPEDLGIVQLKKNR